MGLLYALLLAGAVALVLAAEWSRLRARVAPAPPRRRERRRRNNHLRLVRSESEEFAASVERDLSRIPTIDETRER